MPESLAEELIHSHDLQAIVDLTGSDGSWAMACIRARKPYVAVCFTEFHAKALRERLEHLVFQAMQHEKDPLYQPNLVEVLKSAPTDPSAPDPKTQKTGTPPGPPKKKAKIADLPEQGQVHTADLLKKLKALSKKNKAPKDEEEDEESGEPADSDDE
jgi:hypothetical protein